MAFADDLKRNIAGAVRDGSEKLMMDHARAVKARMGSEGSSLQFRYVKASGSSLEQLGRLHVTGASDAVVQNFNKLLRQRMGQ